MPDAVDLQVFDMTTKAGQEDLAKAAEIAASKIVPLVADGGRKRPPMDFAAGYAHRNSAFWCAFRLVAEGHAALWTNLYRTDMNGPIVLNCTADEQCHLLQSQSALFRREVSELAPTTIIFMTGPRYDNALRTIYQGCALVPLWADVPEREVALVREDRLPMRSIRIYHPTYLQRSRRWHLLARLCAWLHDD
jgi:hypothetical protein